MAGKQRTVYFFEPVVVDENERPQRIAENFWSWAHEHIGAMSERDRSLDLFGRPHVGEARHERSRATDYLYLGRRRPGADWPDTSDATGEIASLASTGFSQPLIEPAYLLGVRGTNYVALMRSTAGPSTSAIARWLSHVCGFPEEGRRLDLNPYARKDQLERLGRAEKVSRMHMTIDPDVMNETNPNDDLGRALKAAQSAGAGGVSVGLTLSFGNLQPTDGAGESLLESVEQLIASDDRIPYKKANITALRHGPDGQLIRDKIDFTRDRVTVRQEVGVDEDAEPTPSVVLSAMLEAIEEFKQKI